MEREQAERTLAGLAAAGNYLWRGGIDDLPVFSCLKKVMMMA
ncbi:hypothetical protein ABM031_18920 [Morganella morganii]